MIRSGLRLLGQTLKNTVKPRRSNYLSLTSGVRKWFGEGGGCCGGKPGCKKQSSPTGDKKTSCETHEHKGDCGHKHHHGEHISADKHDTAAEHKHVHGPGCNHDHDNHADHHHHHEAAGHVHGPGCNHDHHEHGHQHQQVEVPKEVLTVDTETHKLGDQQIETSYTKGAVSLLSNIKGAKNHDRGELYVLMFTCTKCDTKSIRSFTKVAYHEGVVLIRCEGCQNVHLIADNLGWFEDEKTNLQSFAKVDKVVDPVAVVKILQHVFQKHENPHTTEKPAETKTGQPDNKQ